MKKLPAFIVVVSSLLLIAGCGKSDSSSSSGSGNDTAAPTAKIVPARQTSFTEVTSQLDAGGSVYGYLATDQWLAGLSTNVAKFRDFVLTLPDVSSKDEDNIRRVFDLLEDGIAKSGLENLTGVGLSGIQVSPELHRTKFVMHHRKGEGDGLFWNVMGKQAHPMAGLDLLTTNTAIAMFSDVNITGIWEAIESAMTKSGVPELVDGVKKWPREFEKQTKMPWSKVLASLGGEAGFVLTLDDATKISIPIGKPLEIPEPGLLFVLKVNDDLLYDRISSELKKGGSAAVTDEKGLKMCAMPVPLPLPMDLQITVASSAGYLFIASSPTMVRNALAVRDGSQPGLRKTADFNALMKYLPAEGNQFVYVDRRFSTTVLELQKQALSSNNAKAAQMQLFQQYFLSKQPNYGMSIGAHTATGWQTTSVGNSDSSAAIAAAAVVPVAVGAAMVLPAMAKAKEKAQSVSCVNNMKQINLALRMWSLDNGDQFPFNVSKTKGGTLEFCERSTDGYDSNAVLHFQVLSNELATPKILVCPSDHGKQVAINFAGLDASNVSYRIRSGPDVSEKNPQEVILYCPIHRNVGYADGSVKQGKKNSSAE